MVKLWRMATIIQMTQCRKNGKNRKNVITDGPMTFLVLREVGEWKMLKIDRNYLLIRF